MILSVQTCMCYTWPPGWAEGSLQGFARYIKQYLLQSYQELCWLKDNGRVGILTNLFSIRIPTSVTYTTGSRSTWLVTTLCPLHIILSLHNCMGSVRMPISLTSLIMIKFDRDDMDILRHSYEPLHMNVILVQKVSEIIGLKTKDQTNILRWVRPI